jgi:hypothetical protein
MKRSASFHSNIRTFRVKDQEVLQDPIDLALEYTKIGFPGANFLTVLFGHYSCNLGEVPKVVCDPGGE